MVLTRNPVLYLLFFLVNAGAVFHAPPTSVGWCASVPVLLSFDVEMNEDVEALRKLDLKEPATYFVTGQFAEKNQKLVAELAQKNTVGSHSYAHPHLTEISEVEMDKDLLLAQLLIERSIGRPVTWFRAPFMEYSEQVLARLYDLGFRYDSSDQEQWLNQDKLFELAVANIDHETKELLVSDFDLFIKYEMTGEQVFGLLQSEFRKRSRTGRPMVILLHPRIIANHLETFNRFLSYVHEQNGTFLTFDTYIERAEKSTPKRLGIWVDLSLGPHDPQKMTQDLVATGITDVFLMAKSPEGVIYFNRQPQMSPAMVSTDLFGEILQSLKKSGIRVHAWLPVNLDVDMAEKHPEWAMVADNGVRSEKWLSPTHPDVREYLFETVKMLLSRYDLDGIHLDYIRFPSLDYDFSPSALAAFGRYAGIALSGNEPTSLFLSSQYTNWTNHRARVISDLVGEIRHLISSSGKDVTLSAALLPQAATQYEEMRWSGQNYGQLAEHLDLIMPMAYFQNEQQPAEWIGHVITQSRNYIGTRELWIGIPGYRNPGKWEYSTDEFGTALQYSTKGSNGIVLYPYLWLFGKGEPEWNMPAGSTTVLRDFSIEHGFAGSKTRQAATAGRQPTALGVTGLVGGLMIMALLAAGTVIRRRQQTDNRCTASENYQENKRIDWRNLAREIEQCTDISRICGQIGVLLRNYGSQKIFRYRIAFVLDLLQSSPELDSAFNSVADTISGWKILGQRYMEEACRLGYVRIENRKAALTNEGREMLRQTREEGYDRELWEFMELRLHETLTASCPACGTDNATHWFWEGFDCSRCGTDVLLVNCTRVERTQAIVSLTAYTTM